MLDKSTIFSFLTNYAVYIAYCKSGVSVSFAEPDYFVADPDSSVC